MHTMPCLPRDIEMLHRYRSGPFGHSDILKPFHAIFLRDFLCSISLRDVHGGLARSEKRRAVSADESEYEGCIVLEGKR